MESEQKTAKIILTVFDDAVKVEIDECLSPVTVGWFQDEIEAVSAACERILMRSAILPDMRKMPPVWVTVEYRNKKALRERQRFSRGTVVKCGRFGRRVVALPWSSCKNWL